MPGLEDARGKRTGDKIAGATVSVSVVKDPKRDKQLIQKELRALTVRLWDWVRLV